MEKEHLMLMDSRDNRIIEATFFDKSVFFTFWFYSINFYLPNVGICKDDQNIAKKKYKKIQV